MSIETFINISVYVLTGVLGLCVGSFLNVVIYRLPLGMSLSKPASHCTSCDYTLRWYDNIPVLSYIILGGKCRKCRTRISPRYITVEISNALLWVLCILRFGYGDWRQIVCASASALACSLCICIAFIDFEHKIIFDRFHIMMLFLAAAFTTADQWTSVWSHLIDCVFAGGIFWLVGYLVGKRVGREALGGGDIKFAAVSGLFLGWERVLLMMLLSSLSASIVLIIAQKKNTDESEREFPFAPFLTAGFALSLLFGSALIGAYMHLLGLE